MSHEVVEKNVGLMAILILLVISVGGLVEIVPLFFLSETTEPAEGVTKYDALRLEGRDIFVREGCYNCHSQMIRPILAETKRYGEYSKAGEFVYDHPHQWGSRRIGPDLAREGGKQSAMWHVRHFEDPDQITQGSIMPPYPWLLKPGTLNFGVIPGRMEAMRTLGVPYTDEDIENAVQAAQAQAAEIAKKIEDDEGPPGLQDAEVVALIAYVDRLGRDLFAPVPEPESPAEEPAVAQGEAVSTEEVRR